MSDLKIRAIQDRIVVKPIVENSPVSGVVISQSSDSIKHPSKGLVMSAGKGTKLVDMHVKKGDTVKFSSTAGARVKEGGVDIIILDQRDVFYIIEE